MKKDQVNFKIYDVAALANILRNKDNSRSHAED